MLIVCDRYTEHTEKLLEMIQHVDLDMEMMVLKDDGFLPESVLSPCEYFVYGAMSEVLEERELFCDFLNVPEFWEIRSGDMTHGGIYDMNCKKADIYFAKPYEKKNVQRVEWNMEDGWVYKIDYYNKYALKYASAFLDREGNIESKVFYSVRNQEVIVEQPMNDVVTLLEEGKLRAFFTSYAEFAEYCIKTVRPEKKKVLFLQNPEEKWLLDLKSGEESMWKQILFQDQALLEQYVGAGGKNGSRFYAIPKEYPVNNARGEALILTSVDMLEKIDFLIQELPEVTFHIAASTQVSDKLRRLGEYENGKVYPQISMPDLDALWKRCDFYLDINHYWETFNAIDAAHQKNLLIMGFENTLHHRELTSEECIFSASDARQMVLAIKGLVNNPERMQEWLGRQQEKKHVVWENLCKL